MTHQNISTTVQSLPNDPGVYIFKDAHDVIIYIGKAKNIKKRVSSYFQKKNHSGKTVLLVKNIKDIDFIVVNTEVEALLLENKLIKKHKPKYNINLKDSKTFAYIALSDEEFPRIYSTRIVHKKGNYFGPYTDGGARFQLVQLAIQLFKIRNCRNLPKRACLNYHIGLCTAPCINKVTKEEYATQVENTLLFLKGNTKQILKVLNKEMDDASSSQKYEISLEKKHQINAILHLHEKQTVDLIKQYDQDVVALVSNNTHVAISLFSITRGVILGKKQYKFEILEDIFEDFIKMYYSSRTIPNEIVVNVKFWKTDAEKEVLEQYLSKKRGTNVTLLYPQKGDKKKLVKIATKNALYALENTLLKEIQNKFNLPTLPNVIECFDISNLGTEHVVAAMTQWVNGKPNKDAYRKFLIKSVINRQDDFAAMREVILRRYTHLQQENIPFPDLILIDGGPGQLSSALESLERIGAKIPIIGLAKRDEEIYLPHEKEPRKYDKKSSMMLHIRKMRDSVHTLVLSYNKKRRQMKLREQMKDAK
jgi:excinuclease ABC subunit C